LALNTGYAQRRPLSTGYEAQVVAVAVAIAVAVAVAVDLAAVAVELLVAVAVVLGARGAASSYGWAVVVV
jgi:hypothetical protein